MCKHCQDVLGDLALPHDESKCPLQKSFYCSTCAKYGHLTNKCPAKPSTYYTEPCFVEQLIPHTLLKEYNITSRTPLPLRKNEEPQRLLEIQDDDRVITAYLAARSIKSKNKRHALEEYARQQNMRLVYIK
uniref:CCHC-type domain-containing protein n=1 Tax=viral metagenome TaxID=1070528 RepID=A0A6C0KUD6_9ZZZZ